MNRFLSLVFMAMLLSYAQSQDVSEINSFPAASPEIRYSGRVATEDGSAVMGFPGIETVIRFTGSSIALSGATLGQSAHFNVTLDGESLPRLDLPSGSFDVEIASGLDAKAEHELRLVRRSESWIGVARFDSVTLSESGKLLPAPPTPSRKLICIGDSITCGEKADLYGYVENGPVAWNAEKSYGWRLAKRFNAEAHLVSYGGRGLIRDWQGLSEPATGPQLFERVLPDNESLQWNHDRFSPDLVTVCLGTNDFSQGIPEREHFVSAYVAFVRRIHEVHPNARILLISSPWFGDGDPKKEALNSYIEETIATVSADGSDYASHHFFDTTYPGTKRDAHPISPQHRAMAEDISRTLSQWLGW
ncbi:GDSL-type esterase/lipase family protein [Pelagicoccus sp. SDUM812003]|uniref:SGNH/GDSL hydrolase family protein n=1 Tax=Pelagicoccus sp. SDUM812003 TaxID=3041267 RepID=UPI00280D6BFB|nr:GDSL-type esterase/lipase family protein [Pelagicoccus sp. SDUM812003]MDQ8204606.1 GDSL-type esterase/lipase family protein [Pelagicoccus sp. SDUM812003]